MGLLWLRAITQLQSECSIGKPAIFSVRANPELFSDPAQRLHRLVEEDKSAPKLNHFCIIGTQQVSDSYSDAAYVGWKERRTLTLWEPTGSFNIIIVLKIGLR